MYSFAAAYELLCDVRDIIVSPRGRINPGRKFEIKYFTLLQSRLQKYDALKLGNAWERQSVRKKGFQDEAKEI